MSCSIGSDPVTGLNQRRPNKMSSEAAGTCSRWQPNKMSSEAAGTCSRWQPNKMSFEAAGTAPYSEMYKPNLSRAQMTLMPTSDAPVKQTTSIKIITREPPPLFLNSYNQKLIRLL
ncbi:hypothetical protein BsWGS_02677 [Bradybaena similaris]